MAKVTPRARVTVIPKAKAKKSSRKKAELRLAVKSTVKVRESVKLRAELKPPVTQKATPIATVTPRVKAKKSSKRKADEQETSTSIEPKLRCLSVATGP